MEFSIGSVPGGTARPLTVRRRTRFPDRPVIRGRLLGDVFDILPAAILVVSEEGRPLTWNPAAVDLLGDVLGTATTCCEVFGCREPGTALADICVTELALRSDRFTELASFHAPGRPGPRLAVAGAPFDGAGGGRSVLFQLRPATVPAQDSVPADSPAADDALPPGAIRIRTLGETVVETAEGELRGGWLDQRAGRLLKFLVTHRYTPVHADAIAEALWPRANADTSNTVRHFVHALREKLEPERGRYSRSEFVLARNGGYQLNPERVSVDADEFEREARAGLIAAAAHEHDAAEQRLAHAVELYCGDYLEEERFEDWAIAERERLRDLATKPLRLLSALTRDPEQAAAYLERLADMEPLDVDVHRELIAAWMRQGRRSRATRHYRALQSRLMRELGERVSFDLMDLTKSGLPL